MSLAFSGGGIRALPQMMEQHGRTSVRGLRERLTCPHYVWRVIAVLLASIILIPLFYPVGRDIFCTSRLSQHNLFSHAWISHSKMDHFLTWNHPLPLAANENSFKKDSFMARIPPLPTSPTDPPWENLSNHQVKSLMSSIQRQCTAALMAKELKICLSTMTSWWFQQASLH